MASSPFEEAGRRQAKVMIRREISTHSVAWLRVYSVGFPPCFVSSVDVTLKILLAQF
jgi:FlaG/FlaF family flagellin (archaellin)